MCARSKQRPRQHEWEPREAQGWGSQVQVSLEQGNTHMADIRNHAEYKRNRTLLLKDHPVCVLCGVNAATEADHILEADAGGTNALENLRPVCKPCNSRRGQAYRVRKERDGDGLIIGGQTPRPNANDDETTQSVFSVSYTHLTLPTIYSV